MHHSTDTIVEQLVLAGNDFRTSHSMKIRLDSPKQATILCQDEKGRWTGVKRPRQAESWVCPASKKSKLTSNPVQAIVGQVAQRIRSGCHRPDRKNPISLAVSMEVVNQIILLSHQL